MILGVTPGEGQFPGVTRVFKETQALLGPEVFKHVYAEDLNAAKPEDVVIFGAWHETYSVRARRMGNRKGVLWSSPLLQSDLSGEHGLLAHVASMKAQGVIKDLFIMDQGFAQVLIGEGAEGNPGVYWFPAPIAELPKATAPLPTHTDGEGNADWAALFGPWAPRKNCLTQCLAASSAGMKVHGNGAGEYGIILTALGVNFADHGWMPRDEYFNKLSGMAVSLCAYLSESFCYAALDAAALGVPFLASPAIYWAPQEFIRAEPGNVIGLAKQLDSWRNPSVRKNLSRIARHAAEKAQKANNNALLDELKRAGLVS